MDDAEIVLFKKKLKKLEQFKGRGTELISLYIPHGSDRSTVMSQLTEEMSQSSNIKSPQTRKNVQGALRKIDNFLKQINFKIPENGLVIFCGNISEVEGKSNIQLFFVEPPKKLSTKLYWCNSSFHLDPLKEMVKPSDIFGLITIDKREATIAVLQGKKYEILGHFTSNVAGKTRAGGQSSVRFERLREEAARDFFKRVSEKVNKTFLTFGDKLKGIIVGGPGITKNDFLNEDALDYRLKSKIIGIVDVSYTDESGIRELFQKSEEILKDTEVVKEKRIVNLFLNNVVTNGLAAYGQKEVEEALMLGKVDLLLVSEAIDWKVLKFKCFSNGKVKEVIVKEKNVNVSELFYKECNSNAELLEEIDYLDFLHEKANSIGAKTQVISTETPEGMQFLKSFGGIGAILRFK
jgi:peptide chain release factor subunit 1